jgi:hypothetical protein
MSRDQISLEKARDYAFLLLRYSEGLPLISSTTLAFASASSIGTKD